MAEGVFAVGVILEELLFNVDVAGVQVSDAVVLRDVQHVLCLVLLVEMPEINNSA